MEGEAEVVLLLAIYLESVFMEEAEEVWPLLHMLLGVLLFLVVMELIAHQPHKHLEAEVELVLT